eukprot:1544766-Rhodomonas_salina.1
MVERWGKPAGRQQRYPVNQDREQNLEDSAREQPVVRKVKSNTKPKQEEQKGALSMLEECAAAMAKQEAASAERAAYSDAFCERKRTQRMKEFLPKLA